LCHDAVKRSKRKEEPAVVYPDPLVKIELLQPEQEGEA
jgi:hypothetical protein